ncbi:MAG: prolyl oligopeptidase family serine peptidase [Chitinophagales bacterium]
MNRILFLLLLIPSAMVSSKGNKKSKDIITYPATKKIEYTDTYFGTSIEDSYQWLEKNSSVDVKDWVKAQTEVTDRYFKKLSYLKYKMAECIDSIGSIKTIWDAVYNHGNYFFTTYVTHYDIQPVIYIQRGKNKLPEEFINPNSIDNNGLTSVKILSFSNDGKYLAASISKNGSDWQEIWVYDIATGKKLSDKIEWMKFSNLSWYKKGFFYTRFSMPSKDVKFIEQNKYCLIYYHKLGDSQDKDSLTYSTKLSGSNLPFIRISDDEEYMFLTTENREIKWKRTKDINADYKLLYIDSIEKQLFKFVDILNEKFLVLTNYKSPNGRLVLIDPENNNPNNWNTIIPEDKEALIHDVNVTKQKIFITYSNKGTNKLCGFDTTGKNKSEIISVPGQIEVSGSSKNDTILLYGFTSFVYPYTVLEYNVKNGYSDYYNQPTFSYTPGKYIAKKISYFSKDSTIIPMYVVYKKGLKFDGQNPTYLYGYGGFGINMEPFFSKEVITLLENGGIFAMPSLRGGGEFGETWHKAGSLLNKQNTFDDMIAAAEYLISNKYTSNEKLGIAGASNGGLLVGACITQRPDLFKVAIIQVAVLDMLCYDKYTIGSAWQSEYGTSSQSKEVFEYLKGYSPYHNLKPNTRYPATLIMTADHDDRVVPAHSYKFAARLQEYNDKTNPTIIRIEENAGHGQTNAGNKEYSETIDKWAFFYWNIGLKNLTIKK